MVCVDYHLRGFPKCPKGIADNYNYVDHNDATAGVQSTDPPEIPHTFCSYTYLSVCSSVYQSLSVCLLLSVYLSLSVCLFLSVCLSLYVSVCISDCLSLSVSVCLCLSLSLSLYVYVCVSACASACVPVCLSVSFCLSVSQSLYLFLSLCLSVSISLSVSLPVCLSVSPLSHSKRPHVSCRVVIIKYKSFVSFSIKRQKPNAEE